METPNNTDKIAVNSVNKTRDGDKNKCESKTITDKTQYNRAKSLRL
jgi:hypothetical protein